MALPGFIRKNKLSRNIMIGRTTLAPRSKMYWMTVVTVPMMEGAFFCHEGPRPG
jgi:hypothetical protein